MGTGRDKAIAVYVAALGISSVRVVAWNSRGLCRVIAGGFAPCRQGRPDASLTTCSTIWCASDSAAQLVAETAAASLERSGAKRVRQWFAVSCETVIESVGAAIDALGVPTESNANVERNAAAAVEAVERQLQELQTSGGLKAFNKSYREYRLSTLAAGAKPTPYSFHRWNYKLGLVRAVANASRSVDRHAFGCT